MQFTMVLERIDGAFEVSESFMEYIWNVESFRSDHEGILLGGTVSSGSRQE